MRNEKQDSWAEAQRRCRLSGEETEMAKALGFQPHALIKNIPSPSQRWKAPVGVWVRSLYERKFGSKPASPQPAAKIAAPQELRTPAAVIEFRNPDYPWPDKPEIPDLVVRMDDPDEFDDEEFESEFEAQSFHERFEPPEDEEIEEDNNRLLRRQCLFRWAAHSIGVALSDLSEIRKVAAFGSVAQPLEIEIPRFRQYRRYGIEIYHECQDLDLAVWTTDLGKLREMRKAMQRGLSSVRDTPYGGVAHHQVDVHLFEASTDRYSGRLCIFNECPKGKLECLVKDCGAQPFLRQFERYRFNPGAFAAAPKVLLVDKASRFIVRPPHIDGKPGRIEYRSRPADDNPF